MKRAVFALVLGVVVVVGITVTNLSLDQPVAFPPRLRVACQYLQALAPTECARCQTAVRIWQHSQAIRGSWDRVACAVCLPEPMVTAVKEYEARRVWSDTPPISDRLALAARKFAEYSGSGYCTAAVFTNGVDFPVRVRFANLEEASAEALRLLSSACKTEAPYPYTNADLVAHAQAYGICELLAPQFFTEDL